MNDQSRTRNTSRNIVAGLIEKGVIIILPFINRTAILYLLGAEFTGLNSIFTSLLQILNIAELGFNSAVVYSLYKPMAERNAIAIRELLTLFRKIYNIIGTVILCVGLIITPFITYLIKGDYPDTINIYVLYLMYLLNSVLSYYLFAYKEVLLISDQRKDISSLIRTGVNVVKYILQFFVLLLFRNFYAYMLVSMVSTVSTNIVIELCTRKRYPDYIILKNAKIKMPSDLKKRVAGLFVDRICDTCRNSFDTIIISSTLGLVSTAIYSNYYYIYSALYGIMLVVCNAMQASVGNSIATESEEKNYNNFITFSFAFAWINGWCTVTLFILYQPFMKIWVGDKLLLSTYNMILFCVYFFIININNIRNQYVSGSGIWWRLKLSYVVEACANLGLNILLGKLFGISGVLWATIITILFFNFVWRTNILFKSYFVHHTANKVFLNHLYYAIITFIAAWVTSIVSRFVTLHGIPEMIVKGIICLILPNIIFLIGYNRTNEFSSVKKFLYAHKLLK